jgi:hypothetical protein
MNFMERYPHLTILMIVLAIAIIVVVCEVSNAHAGGFTTVFDSIGK